MWVAKESMSRLGTSCHLVFPTNGQAVVWSPDATMHMLGFLCRKLLSTKMSRCSVVQETPVVHEIVARPYLGCIRCKVKCTPFLFANDLLSSSAYPSITYSPLVAGNCLYKLLLLGNSQQILIYNLSIRTPLGLQ